MPLFTAGSVDQILHFHYKNGIKDETIIATILKQIILGLIYFHNKCQIHRDIKGGNILIGLDGKIVLSDFGISTKVKSMQGRKHTFVGSPCWMAPEVMEQRPEGYDLKADIWSLGITALELAQGKPPHHNLQAMDVLMKITNHQAPSLSHFETWTPEFRDFVSSCLQK